MYGTTTATGSCASLTVLRVFLNERAHYGPGRPLIPYLGLRSLGTCRPLEISEHAEKVTMTFLTCSTQARSQKLPCARVYQKKPLRLFLSCVRTPLTPPHAKKIGFLVVPCVSRRTERAMATMTSSARRSPGGPTVLLLQGTSTRHGHTRGRPMPMPFVCVSFSRFRHVQHEKTSLQQSTT